MLPARLPAFLPATLPGLPSSSRPAPAPPIRPTPPPTTPCWPSTPRSPSPTPSPWVGAAGAVPHEAAQSVLPFHARQRRLAMASDAPPAVPPPVQARPSMCPARRPEQRAPIGPVADATSRPSSPQLQSLPRGCPHFRAASDAFTNPHATPPLQVARSSPATRRSCAILDRDAGSSVA